MSTCRVAQWATGNIGTRALRAVVEHPALELVGVHVHSAAKVDRDAGELCGLGTTGVAATGDVDDIVALDPDCVLYMGFGRPPAAFDERRLAHGRVSFGPSLRLLAEALGLPLDDVEASGEVATASRTVEIAAGTIEAGTVAAQRLTVAGVRGGRPLLRFRACWYCTTELDPAWDVRPTGWHVAVEGDTPLDVDVRFPVPIERMAEFSPGYTAHRAVNAVPVVCQAPLGIRTSVELPQVVATLG